VSESPPWSVQQPSAPGKPVAVALADFNHDGIADLAAPNEDGMVTILLGTGKATYHDLAAKHFMWLLRPIRRLRGLVIGDFNDDGRCSVRCLEGIEGTLEAGLN
jgi:VCBS repeat protein